MNPNCDLSDVAGGFSKAAKAAGLSYEQVILRIVELALARKPNADTIPLSARSRTARRGHRPARAIAAGGAVEAPPVAVPGLVEGRVGRRRIPARALAVTLALVLTGCHRNQAAAPAAVATPPRPALGEVILRDSTPPSATPPSSIDFDRLQDELRARLAASGLFTPADAGAPSAVVRVRADVALDGAEVEDKGVARAAVRLRFDTRPSDAPGAIEEDLAGEGEQVYPIQGKVAAKARGAKAHPGVGSAPAEPGPEEKRALFARLALRVAGDLIDGFAARQKLATAPESAIRAALRADGGELQEQAIRVAGERKLRDEVPALLDLLDNPSESVRDAALGALIQIGDRRAVTALTKSRSLHDRREMRKIIEAIATLGGDEALDYLSFVAASHDDEEIRALAAAAKQRLERHQQARRTSARGQGPRLSHSGHAVIVGPCAQRRVELSHSSPGVQPLVGVQAWPAFGRGLQTWPLHHVSAVQVAPGRVAGAGAVHRSPSPDSARQTRVAGSQ